MRTITIEVYTPEERIPSAAYDLVQVFLEELPYSISAIWTGREFRVWDSLEKGFVMMDVSRILEWSYSGSGAEGQRPMLNNPNYRGPITESMRCDTSFIPPPDAPDNSSA